MHVLVMLCNGVCMYVYISVPRGLLSHKPSMAKRATSTLKDLHLDI